MYNILICDDDEAIVQSLKIYLTNEGWNVICAYNGFEALEAIKGSAVHCMVLDIMMPGIDGLTTTMKIREHYNFPIILLSAKSEDTDKIAGLSFGADDYVTKPFNPLELIARIKSQIRRYINLGSMEITQSQLVTGGIVLDKDTKKVTRDGDEVRLTAIEYKILEFLMSNMGRVFSSSQIYEAVWNEPSYTSEKTVTVHIRNIREKIEINPKEPQYLKVVYGLGYKCEKI